MIIFIYMYNPHKHTHIRTHTCRRKNCVHFISHIVIPINIISQLYLKTDYQWATLQKILFVLSIFSYYATLDDYKHNANDYPLNSLTADISNEFPCEAASRSLVYCFWYFQFYLYVHLSTSDRTNIYM